MVKAAAQAADAAAVSGPAGRPPSPWSLNAVTGAVTAVTWGHDPALGVTCIVPTVIAVAGRHSLSRRADGPGHLPSLAHEALAGANEVATALRDTSLHARPSRYPLHRCRSRRWSRCLKRPRGRVFVPKRPKLRQNSPRRHRLQDLAMAASRRLVNKSSDRLHRACPLRARRGPYDPNRWDTNLFEPLRRTDGGPDGAGHDLVDAHGPHGPVQRTICRIAECTEWVGQHLCKWEATVATVVAAAAATCHRGNGPVATSWGKSWQNSCGMSNTSQDTSSGEAHEP
jgi:hypothetical protein